MKRPRITELKVTEGSGNVFLDLGFDKAEAENLKLRAELIREGCGFSAWMRWSMWRIVPG